VSLNNVWVGSTRAERVGKGGIGSNSKELVFFFRPRFFFFGGRAAFPLFALSLSSSSLRSSYPFSKK
jgi:hypothetical protein